MGNVKKIISELKGKTVMTNDGQILGVIENFIMETATGDLEHVLVIPAEEIDARMYKTDPQGRLILPFSEMRAVKDVVVMSIE